MSSKLKIILGVLVIIVLPPMLFFLLFFCQYHLVMNKCEAISMDLDKYEIEELNQEKIEKEMLDDFGKETVTNKERLHTITRLYVDDYMRGEKQIEIVGYNIYFVRCFEFIYDERGNVLNYISTYD